jgi:Periplasmic binding protein
MSDRTTFSLTRRTMLAATALSLAAPRAFAQGASDIKIGLIVPLSGLYARPGAVMRMGAEMAVDHINSAGGVKALGGAKLKLVVIDCGDTTEKAKNAAQRMVAQETDLVAASGAKMKELPIDDFYTKGTVREDGRVMRPYYLLQVKKPSESRYPFDYLKLLATVPAEEAARPLSESACPMVKHG